MKDPCIIREQFIGIHDVLNDQWCQMHYRVNSNMVSHLEVFQCERVNTAKQKHGLLNVLEAKTVQYDF